MNKQKIAKKLVKFLKERYGKGIRAHPRGRNVFKVLIATILSQRTRDENTEKATTALFSKADTPEKILKLKQQELEILIRPSGPYKQKAKRIREITWSWFQDC